MKGKLKKALQAAGLDEGLAEMLNITSEAQIEGVIAKLKPTPTKPNLDEIISSDEFKEYIETTGFDAVIEKSKALKSGVDKKVTTGVNTFKENMERKKPEEPNSEIAELKEMLQKNAEKLQQFEQQQTHQSKVLRAKAALAESKIPKAFVDSWANRIDVEKPIESQIKALETEYETISESVLGENAGKGLPSGGGPTENAPAEDDVDTIIESVA